MQTIFCTECGNKMLYSGAKPKFCSSCGAPIGKTMKRNAGPEIKSTLSAGATSFKDRVRAGKPDANLNEDETNIDYVPRIDNFQCDFESSGNVTYKFEDIIENAEEKES